MEKGYPCLVCPQNQGLVGPYLGPAADEQVQHILTDLVIVLIQKLVNLAKSKTSQGQGDPGQDVPIDRSPELPYTPCFQDQPHKPPL